MSSKKVHISCFIFALAVSWDISLQNQLYIWCGTLSGVLVILIIGFIMLVCHVHILRKQMSSQNRPTLVLHNDFRPNEPEYASYFGSPVILPDEELAIRGFSERNPKHHDNHQQPSSDSMIFSNEYSPKPVIHQEVPRLSGRPRNTLLNNTDAYQQNRRYGEDGNDNPNFTY